MHRKRLHYGVVIVYCALVLANLRAISTVRAETDRPNFSIRTVAGDSPILRQRVELNGGRRAAAALGGVCGGPGAGSCYEPHAPLQPGCNESACCEAVCAFDPFCCDTVEGTWDGFCVNEALAVCSCTPASQPLNDLCANAQTIGLGDTPLNNQCATAGGPIHDSKEAPCNDNFLTGLGLDIWYKHVAGFTGSLEISTCGQMNPGWDTQIAVYAGCNCVALSDPPLACDNDTFGCDGGSTAIVIAVTQGTCYTIRVGSSYSGISGSGTLTLALHCPADFNGDNAANAFDLALLLGAWGANPGHAADLNHDGLVNATDLAQLLGAWGSC